MTVFLDSNVFLYSVGADHPYRDACQAVLVRFAEGSLAAVTSTEILQEVLHVLRRRARHEDAVRLGRRILQLFPDLLPVTGQAMEHALTLIDRLPTLSTRDAVHVGTMKANELKTIVSADRHFDHVDEIRRVDPMDLVT